MSVRPRPPVPPFKLGKEAGPRDIRETPIPAASEKLDIAWQICQVYRNERYPADLLDQSRAEKEFLQFPLGARVELNRALTIVAEGGKPDVAKPLNGLGSGVWELALRHRGDAFRIVYVLQLGDAIWVVHAFQKKSKSGIATPKHEIDLIRERIKRLKEKL